MHQLGCCEYIACNLRPKVSVPELLLMFPKLGTEIVSGNWQWKWPLSRTDVLTVLSF